MPADHRLEALIGNVKAATTRATLDRICDRVHAEFDVRELCGSRLGLRLMAAVEDRKAYLAAERSAG
jgi:hypothetical protein